jgi:general secretion pathway protein A
MTPGKVAAALLVLAVGGGLWWQTQRAQPQQQPNVVALPTGKAALAHAPGAAPAAAGAATALASPAPASGAASAASGKPGPGDPSHASPAHAAMQPAVQPAAPLAEMLAQLPSNSAQAWAAHDGLWAWGSGGRNPCVQGASPAWRCFSSVNATLAQLAQINRPGLLTLYDAQGQPRQALLTRMEAQQLTLTLAVPGGAQTLSIPSAALAPYWRGQFAAPWAVPEALRSLPRRDGKLPAPDSAAAQALQAALGPHATADEALALRLRRFQLAQSLTPDALLGNITLMQVARAAMPEQPQLLP